MEMKRILVVMPNWFGETLFVTPFLRALHGAFPQAWIVGMGVARCQEVLAGNPHVHEWIDCDERGAQRGLAGRWALISTLRSTRCDAAVILRRSLGRTVLLSLAGIRRRIGFANGKSGWLLSDRVALPHAPTHKALGYLHLLAPLGVASGDHGHFEYYPRAEERAWANATLRALGWTEDKPLVVIHPGANWPHKRWPTERFAQLADRLAGERSVRIVITGGPDDGLLLDDMVTHAKSASMTLAGQTTFRQLAACLEQARLVITNDTGPVHLAAALGRPVIGLYGPTSPTITGPLGPMDRIRVIHHPTCCPSVPCYHPHHPGYPGMASISVEEVYQAAVPLLGDVGNK